MESSHCVTHFYMRTSNMIIYVVHIPTIADIIISHFYSVRLQSEIRVQFCILIRNWIHITLIQVIVNTTRCFPKFDQSFSIVVISLSH